MKNSILIFLFCALFANSAFALGNDNPVVITGTTSDGFPIYAPIGTGAAGSVPMPISSSAPNEPCSYAAKSTVPISVTSATTTQLVALTASQVVYVCGFSITIAPSATSADTALFEYGTSTNCTGTNALTGTFGNGDLTTAASPTVVSYGGAGATIFSGIASNAICIVTAGTTVNVQGTMSYVKQ